MRQLRTFAALFACLGALAVAVSGCGGDESSSGFGDVLSYVPADTPFAVEIDTDLEGDQFKALDAIINRFPGADSIKDLLKAQLSMGQEGVDFDKDLKPLLGNPAVISATDVTSFLSDSADAGLRRRPAGGRQGRPGRADRRRPSRRSSARSPARPSTRTRTRSWRSTTTS